MEKGKILAAIAMLMMSIAAWSQTMNGYIYDKETGERLAEATVFVKYSSRAVRSNAYGYYSIRVASQDTIGFTAAGYATEYVVAAAGGETLDMGLLSLSKSIEEVTVVADEARRNIYMPRMSRHHLTQMEVSTNTVMFGEADALKVLQFMPGVNAASDGSVNMSVRGGSHDQNLIMLDEAVVYNPSHAMGVFSAFSTDAVGSIDFYKGGVPARYGGRLSAVTDIHLREGNSKIFTADGSVGTVASHLTLEGPICNDRASFILSGRYGYGDLSNKVTDFLDNDYSHGRDQMRFYDVTAKVNWKINEKNRIFASAYTSHDKFKCLILSQDNKQEWGNKTGTLRWNHAIGNNGFMNFTMLYSDYDYMQRQDNDARNYEWTAGMSELTVKADVDHYVDRAHLTYGIAFEHHNYNPGQVDPIGNKSIMKPMHLAKGTSNIVALYAEDEHLLTDRLSMTGGIRITAANNDKTYFAAEPRAVAAYKAGELAVMKASYMRTVQFQHLLSNSSLGLPTDIWTPVSRAIKPQNANTVAVGLQGAKGAIEYSVEAYMKKADNIIDFKEGTELTMNADIEKETLKGHGKSKGVELMVKYELKRLMAMASYTLSETKRQIDGINNNEWYYAIYDQRHNFSIMTEATLGKRNQWKLGATFRYHTGGRTTLPNATFTYMEVALSLYSERNGYVMPDFHRLDFSCSYKFRDRGTRWNSEITLSVYNCYNRKNAYSMFIRQNQYETESYQGYMMYLYGTVPSLTYHFHF